MGSWMSRPARVRPRSTRARQPSVPTTPCWATPTRAPRAKQATASTRSGANHTASVASPATTANDTTRTPGAQAAALAASVIKTADLSCIASCPLAHLPRPSPRHPQHRRLGPWLLRRDRRRHHHRRCRLCRHHRRLPHQPALLSPSGALRWQSPQGKSTRARQLAICRLRALRRAKRP